MPRLQACLAQLRACAAMLGLDFIKANRAAVERAIATRASSSTSTRCSRSTARCAGSRPRSRSCAPSAMRSAPVQERPAGGTRPRLAPGPRKPGAKAGELEGQLAEKEAALNALLLRLPEHPL